MKNKIQKYYIEKKSPVISLTATRAGPEG